MKRTREMAIKQKHQLQVVTLIRTSQNEIFNCECGNNLFKKKEFSTLYKCSKCEQIYRSDERGIRKRKRKGA